MLDTKIIKKISDYVYIKPRTIQEISTLINKNWRTADRYVNEIINQTGNLSIRTFREGTKGALKIVYWSNIEKIHSYEFQEKLFNKIERTHRKIDFSPFDIFQYVDKDKRHAFLEEQIEEGKTAINEDLIGLLRSAKKQVLFFSGNLSWANLIQDKEKVIDVLEELARKNILIKMLSSVDISGIENTQKVMAINEILGKDSIEIKHAEQPLRAIIIDDKMARFKEVKNPRDYKKGELKKKTFIFYDIYDKEWIEWLQKVFWNMFRTAIPANKRVEDIKTIQKLK